MVEILNFHENFRFQVVENKLSMQREPIEKQLHDFVKIMKYNDLNLWSVKASAQKAHKQLFRLLKQFKLSANDLVAPLLNEVPPMLLAVNHGTKKGTFSNDQIISCNDFYARRAVDLSLKIASYFADYMHLEDIQGVCFAVCCVKNYFWEN